MIKNIRHTGIVVRDLDNAIRFYEGLGFSTWKKEFESGPYLDKVVGLKNVKIEIAKLKSPCGNLLELLQYHSHPLDKKIKDQPSNQLGCSHIAFTVEDVDEILKNIQGNGGSLVNMPETTPDGKFRVVYAHDHEGVLLEIVEEI